jgi:O-6-methylguanine DNA methyltransferase
MKKDINELMKKYTPFQRAVWLACMEIPRGQTRSYGWIAKRIGRPGAVRAVGTALGKNPFAPLVPCHRVIKSDGTLGGFSAPGGIKTKIKLLRKEKAPGFQTGGGRRKPQTFLSARKIIPPNRRTDF